MTAAEKLLLEVIIRAVFKVYSSHPEEERLPQQTSVKCPPGCQEGNYTKLEYSGNCFWAENQEEMQVADREMVGVWVNTE